MRKGEEEFLSEENKKHQTEYCSRIPLSETNIRPTSSFAGSIWQHA
jgi:hypothetical protein